eukprot:1348285-Amorphochlora_amoeboformis.AAC.2
MDEPSTADSEERLCEVSRERFECIFCFSDVPVYPTNLEKPQGQARASHIPPIRRYTRAILLALACGTTLSEVVLKSNH